MELNVIIAYGSSSIAEEQNTLATKCSSVKWYNIQQNSSVNINHAILLEVPGSGSGFSFVQKSSGMLH